MTNDVSTLRQKANKIALGSLLGIFLVLLFFIYALPNKVFGIPSSLIVFVMGATLWLYVVIRLIPRCPNCGLGLFSVVEIGRVPVIVKSWVGKNCYGCGRLHDEA